MTSKEITFDTLFGEVKPQNEYSIAQAIIIYGNLGTGKTTLATTCSELGKTALINFENRISHIKESENLRIIPTSQGEFREDKRCTYEQFTKFVDFVVNNNVKIKYTILDTLDMMLQSFIKGMLKKGEIQDKYYGRADVYPKIVEYIQKLKETGTTIIITAQEETKNGETDLLIVPNFKGHINPIVDGIFYLKATEDDNRVLLLKPVTNIFVKPPTVPKECFNNISKDLENPTWKDIMEEISEKEENIVDPVPVAMADDEVLKFKLSEHNINVKDFCKHFDIKKSNIAEKIVMLDAMVDEYVNMETK